MILMIFMLFNVFMSLMNPVNPIHPISIVSPVNQVNSISPVNPVNPASPIIPPYDQNVLHGAACDPNRLRHTCFHAKSGETIMCCMPDRNVLHYARYQAGW